MGGHGEKQTNKMLGQQTDRFNQFADLQGREARSDKDFYTGNRGKLSDALWNMYSSAGSGGAGGGGFAMPTYADAIENEAQARFRKAADEGLFTPEQERSMIQEETSSLPSYFEGIREQLRLNPTAGYSGQLAKAGREGAREMSFAHQSAINKIANAEAENRKWGTQGLYTSDEALIGRKMQIERERNAARQAAASAAASGRARGFDEQRSILHDLMGLGGQAGDYAQREWDRQLAGLGGATNTITSRVREPNFMDALQQGVNIAGTGAGAFLGMKNAGMFGGAGNGAGGVANIPTNNFGQFDWSKLYKF